MPERTSYDSRDVFLLSAWRDADAHLGNALRRLEKMTGVKSQILRLSASASNRP